MAVPATGPSVPGTAATLLLAVCWSMALGAEPSIRLPGHSRPSRYRLDIVTDLDGNFTFHGRVSVDLEAITNTTSITLHSQGLIIDEDATRLTFTPSAEDPKRVAVTGHKTDPDLGFLTLELAEPLQPGSQYRLDLKYRGWLADTLSGYYKQSYHDSRSSNISWIAATVFEPTEARRAFPCWDEPAFKARFQLNLARPENIISIANMPVDWTSPMKERPGWVWDRYQESPPMSTYLVAWVLGALSHRETTEPGGRQFRVWARPEAINQSDYALRIGPPILARLQEYVGFGEQLPKTDLVALPSFISNAVENWGIPTFGEQYLLLQPSGAAPASKEEVASVVAHELAHSWFGNLVTPAWWSAIWLNEGFATYFSTIGVDHVEPDFDIHSLVATQSFLYLFNKDALRSSRPLTAKAATGSDLYQIFNGITYFKGYYLLRMLNHTLGEDTFRHAIARYLADHRFDNVHEDDFWAVLDSQARRDGVPLPSGTDVKTLMSAWSKQPGFPVVSVARNYSAATADVSQARFLRLRGDIGKRIIEKTGWWVPLTFTSGPDGNVTRLWLDPSESATIRDLPGDDQWILFNIRASGLYRVNYDERNWELLIQHLNSERFDDIPVLNRALLLDDALDLARANMLPYHVAFNVTRYMSREQHYLPWKAALTNMNFVGKMLKFTNSSESFQKFMRRLVSPQFEALGFMPRPDDTLMQSLNRKQMVKWACSTGQQQCVEKSLKLFRQWRDSNGTDNPVPADVRASVYCTAIAQGDEDDWDFLWGRYRAAEQSSERHGVLAALGCSKSAQLLGRFLRWSIAEDSGISKGHSASVFEAVARNPAGKPLADVFLKNNIEQIQTYIGTNPFHLPRLLEALAYGMSSKKELQELEEFETRHVNSLKSATQTMDTIRETVQFNIEWLDTNYATIEQWLRDVSTE